MDPHEALDRLPATARPAFRAALREAFVGGRPEALSGAAGRSDPEVEPQLGAALDAWAPPPARAGFRRELGARFVRARVEQGAPRPRSGREHRSPRQTAVRRRPPAPARPAPLLALAGLAAAAAVVALLTMGRRGEPAPSWRVLPVAQPARGELDGLPLAEGGSAALPRALREGGCSMAVDAGLLRVSSDEHLALEVGPGTALSLVRREVHQGDEALVLELGRSGHVRLRTGEGFEGRVVLRTPEGRIELTDGVLGVDVYEDGTCVCLLIGHALVVPTDGEPLEVRSGRTRFLRRGGEVQDLELVEGHRGPLEDLSAIASSELF